MTTRITHFVAFFVIAFAFAFASAVQANTISVNSLSDAVANDGACTLREAITAANTDTTSGAAANECAAGSGDDLIQFGVAGTILPGSQLPTITTVIHIDGYSAPGAVKNTQNLAQGSNAALKIVIDGVNAYNIPGLFLSGSGASGSIIEGLVFSNTGTPACCNNHGIRLQSVDGAATTIIRGNYIGTDITGMQRSTRGSSMLFVQYSANIVVGSDTAGPILPAAANVISGSQSYGVFFYQSSNVRIRGNYVGTNAAGTAELHHSNHGLWLDSITATWVSDNVISGNGQSGILLFTLSSDVHIERNIIGSSAAGTAPLPNGFGGIWVTDNPNAAPFAISNVDIVENLVAHNLCPSCSGGIAIGVQNSNNTAVGIRMRRNRVYANQNLEIDLAPNNPTPWGLVYGVTPNDDGDADSGPNNFQNFPVITSATGNGTEVLVDYSLNSEASKSYTIEFFHTATCDDSGYGGAEVYLDEWTDSTDVAGNMSGQKILSGAPQTGYITATATNSSNGTSEFSECMEIMTPSDTRFEDGFEGS